MRKLPPPKDPVVRRIYKLLPGPSTQARTSTARRVLRRVYEESGVVLNGQYAAAVLMLRDAGLVKFDVSWNQPLHRQEWHVRLTKNCKRVLDRAKSRRVYATPSDRPQPSAL